MLENLKRNIQNSIHWLTQHAEQDSHFSSKKNDQLLQNFVNDLIYFSEIKMSSDIHIEPQEDFIRIRLRIDGVLSDQFHLPKFILEQLCSKLKILANIDIAQRRLPQDGKFIFHPKNGLKTHIRMSTCPT
ncbi:MAG: ATPase, T2SS/T4P/T4SS family, partial [Pseudomonadota bacterium]